MNLLDLTQGVCYRLWSFHAFGRNIRWSGRYLLVGIRAAFPCCIVLRVVLRKIRSGQANSLTPLLLLLGWLSHFSNCKKALVMIRLLSNPLSAALPAGWKKNAGLAPGSVHDARCRAGRRRRSKAGTIDI